VLQADSDTLRRARLLIVMSLVFDAFAFYYFVQYLGMHLTTSAGFLITSVILCLCVPIILRATASLPIAGNYMCFVVMATFASIVFFEGGAVSTTRYWMVTVPMCAMLYNGLRSGGRWLIWIIALNLVFYGINRTGAFVFPNALDGMDDIQKLTKGVVSVIGVATVGYAIIRAYEQEKNRSLDVLNALREESERRAKDDYAALEVLKAENEQSAADNLRRAERQREYLSASVESLLGGLKRLDAGDLTVRLDHDRTDEILRVFESFNSSVENVGQMLQSVVSSVQENVASVGQISATTEELSAAAKMQMGEITQVASSVEELSRTISQSAQQIAHAAQEFTHANNDAVMSDGIMRNMIANVEQLGTVVLQSSEKIAKLGESSEAIGEIVEVIEEIADQTNLLALNAAIESARAGEQGRGFAVVADEVRKLAERTQQATKQISTMITSIRNETAEVIRAMTEGRALVGQGKRLASETSEALSEIIARISNVSEVISQLAAAGEQEAAMSAEMARSMTAISSVVEGSSDGIEDIAQGIENLLRQTEALEHLTRQFTLTSTTRNGSPGATAKTNPSINRLNQSQSFIRSLSDGVQSRQYR
jgi:methyl-accepting chemotaxis protein